jgi:hypothetical protein
MNDGIELHDVAQQQLVCHQPARLTPRAWLHRRLDSLRRPRLLHGWKRAYWLVAAIILLGVILRYVFVANLHPPSQHIYSDMGGYVAIAHEMSAGKFEKYDLFQSVGYPLLMTLSLKLIGTLRLAMSIQLLASIAAFVLMWRGSVRFLGERRALIVLVIGTLHFPFISLTGFYLTETIFTLFLALLYYLLARFRFPWRPHIAFILGLVFLGASWFKGSNMFFLPLLVVWAMAWVWRRRSLAGGGSAEWRAALRAGAGFAAGVAVIAITTATVSYSMTGQARVSASAGGLNFVEGKCPDKINHDSTGAVWASPLFGQIGEGGTTKYWPEPFTNDAFFWKAGWNCIQRDPWVLASSVRYIYYLFFDNQLWPSNSSEFAILNRYYQMFFSALLFPGFLIGLLLMFRRPLAGTRPTVLLVGSILLCSWFFKSEIRFRVPFDVVIIPLSVLGWSWLLATLFGSRRSVVSGRSTVRGQGGTARPHRMVPTARVSILYSTRQGGPGTDRLGGGSAVCRDGS